MASQPTDTSGGLAQPDPIKTYMLWIDDPDSVVNRASFLHRAEIEVKHVGGTNIEKYPGYAAFWFSMTDTQKACLKFDEAEWMKEGHAMVKFR